MSESSWSAIRRQVYARAHGCCEYCRSCEENTGQSMEIEHIDPNGGDDSENLCLSCGNCNRSKGVATSAVDPHTGEMVSLFNPRQEPWSEHFQWVDRGAVIQGRTSIGRATVERFKMNRTRMVTARQRWVTAGHHPPVDE